MEPSENTQSLIRSANFKLENLSRDSVLQPTTSLNCKIRVVNGIFIIYMGSRRAIYNDIAASRSNFFVLGNKIPSGRAVPSGIFVASDEKNSPCRDYIVVYIPQRPHIYITNIPLCGLYTENSIYCQNTTYYPP